MRSELKVVTLLLISGLLVLAGCGSSSSSTTTSSSTPTETSAATTPTTSTATPTTSSLKAAGGSGETLSLSANAEGQLKYNTTTLTAKAGKVSVDFTNMSPLSHNVTIESSSHTTVGATPTFQGGSKTLSLDLKPGVYTFYCSVPGHRMAGMEGKLTVH